MSISVLRIRLELQNLSNIACQATSQTAERRDALQEKALQSLATHDDTVKTSFGQVYSLVDGRIAKVENMLQAQADRVHSGVSGQPGPVCRIRPANRRRPSPPQLPARSEGVRIHLNQYRSNCHSRYQCTCHMSQKAATPGFMDLVLGQLFVGYSGLPILSSKCDERNCPGQRGILVSS